MKYFAPVVCDKLPLTLRPRGQKEVGGRSNCIDPGIALDRKTQASGITTQKIETYDNG